ncbi:MAG: hypothetical protein OH319_05175 [Candidatus Parvarchaeota archaeon]|nr:hypothetical protein [Candidatus Jingweiarchaeum tengchongense]
MSPKVSDLLKKRPNLDLRDMKEHVIEFAESSPRRVVTKFGDREVINVIENNEEKSLWLSQIGIKTLVENLFLLYSDLRGKKIKIKCIGKHGRMYDYEYEVLK